MKNSYVRECFVSTCCFLALSGVPKISSVAVVAETNGSKLKLKCVV